MGNETVQGPGEPDRTPPPVGEDDSANPHTTPEEGHPAGDGPRSDRDVGGPTSPEDTPEGDEETARHNPGEPEFGEHAGEAEHNPGEPEFDPEEGNDG